MVERVRPLCTMKPGEAGVITALYLHGSMRHRLLDLGWIPGTRIQKLYTARRGDPSAYAVRGVVIALRACDAKLILVQPETR